MPADNNENDGCPVCTARTGNSQACNGCKIFYSKNRQKTSISCDKEDYNCIIVPTTSRGPASCRGCRFKKCLEVGMKEQYEQKHGIVDKGKRVSDETREDEEVKRPRSSADAPGTSEAPSTSSAVSTPAVPPPMPAPTTSSAVEAAVPPPIPPMPAPAARKPVTPVDVANFRILENILPVSGTFRATVIETIDRRDYLKFALTCSEAYHYKVSKKVLNTHPAFFNLNQDTKSILYRDSFFLVHILDVTHEYITHQLTNDLTKNDVPRSPITHLAVFGNVEAVPAFNNLMEKIKSSGFRKYDYSLFRQYALFDSILMENEPFYQKHHLDVVNAWIHFRQLDEEAVKRLMKTYGEFLKVAKINREYLTRMWRMGRVHAVNHRIIHSAISFRANQP